MLYHRCSSGLRVPVCVERLAQPFRAFRGPGAAAFGGKARTVRGGSVFTVPSTPPPDLVSISPTSGGTGGGTFVTATGTNFIASGLAVTVGGAAATSVTFVNGTTVTFVTPSGVAGARDVVLSTSEGSDTLVGGFTYSASRPAPVFWAEWSTQTGNSSNALRDGTRFSAVTGTNTLVEVVTNAGESLDLPTTNILKVAFDASNGGAKYCENTGMALPAVGESRYYRWYTRLVAPNNGAGYNDGETHPVQPGGNFGIGTWIGHHFTDVANEWALRWTVSQAFQNPSPWGWFRKTGLSKTASYRVELQIYRVTASTFNMHARVYNIAGTLLFDDDDFLSMNGSDTLANAPALDDNDVNSLQNFVIGTNGLANVTAALTYQYFAAPCIRSDDWCGAWNSTDH